MRPTIMAEDEPINILLVDDQPAKLLGYQTILEDLGENLLMAHSAREALEILLQNDVALLLVDVVMPELDGFELVEVIRAHPRFTHSSRPSRLKFVALMK
jgi:CheY-like chemotaxis protein